MKRSILLIVSLALLIAAPVQSQGRFLKNVAKDVKGDLLGSSGGSSKKTTQPEPSCACSNAEQILSLSQYKLEYSEVNIDLMEDGSFLVYSRMDQKYYIINNGVMKGPYADGSPALAPYTGSSDDPSVNPLTVKFKEYISTQGDKFIIKFNGKTYGPYARVDHFAVTGSKDKFAATVVDNIAVTEDEGEKMDKAIKNAKTDAERMELAMQYSQQMSQKMMAAGGAQGISPKLVSNIEGATYNPMMAGPFNSKMKFDDIVYTKMADVMDLRGKKLITVKQQDIGNEKIFVNSANTVYASYADGTITLSDGKSLSDLFNPHLVKADGKTWLAYMYYSPAKNAIMQCKIAF
ncbi:MAG TPA: hypothetical protein VK207_10920 [Bacteroidales bacterium]|nr:hypothetical protein [Bacteroidales bacterium]